MVVRVGCILTNMFTLFDIKMRYAPYKDKVNMIKKMIK